MNLLNIGYQQYINVDKVMAIVPAGAIPVKRDVQEAKKRGMLINCTKGRKALSVIYLSDLYIVTSSFKSDLLQERAKKLG